MMGVQLVSIVLLVSNVIPSDAKPIVSHSMGLENVQGFLQFFFLFIFHFTKVFHLHKNHFT